MSPSGGPLARECDCFCRHLIGQAPDTYVTSRYREAHRVHPDLAARDRFDRALVRIARLHPRVTAMADGWARLFAPRAALRRKLVLLVAILEVSTPFDRAFEPVPGEGRPAAVCKIAWRAGLSLATAAAASVVLLPLLAATRLFPGGREWPR